MDFTDQLKQFSKQIDERTKNIATEEATKMSLILPFFQILGYDVFNPAEFCPEYIADVGIKKGEKVDYAILKDGNPIVLVECKSCTDSLEKHGSQLFRYFGTSMAKFGILTNGIIYRFYTDLEESNKMDLSPFLEVNMLELRDMHINELKKFCKLHFDSDKIFSTASELKYSNLIKELLSKELEEPSEDFVKHILYHTYEGQRTQKVIDKFSPIVKRAFNSFINEIVNQKISSALSEEPEQSTDETEYEEDKTSKVITTEEELQAFYIVQAILIGTVNAEDVVHRDTESYFGILYQNNNRKPICRVNFDTKKKQIMIPDENKTFSKYYLDSINDIYKYKDQILSAVKTYISN